MTKGKNPKSTKIRVLIVDDHPIMRQGLATLINAQSGLTVCGEAENGHEALAAVKALKPDLAVIDITMRGMDGIDLIKRIRQRSERCLVLVLSMHEENNYAERVLRAGAQGYIMKQEVRGNVLKRSVKCWRVESGSVKQWRTSSFQKSSRVVKTLQHHSSLS